MDAKSVVLRDSVRRVVRDIVRDSDQRPEPQRRPLCDVRGRGAAEMMTPEAGKAQMLERNIVPIVDWLQAGGLG